MLFGNKAMIEIARQLAVLLRRMRFNGTEFCWTAETIPT